MNNPRKVPLIWGVVVGGIGIWTLFGMEGAMKFLIGPACIFFGWHSLKSAVYMTAKEIDEIITRGDSTPKSTRDKFRDL